MQNHFSRNAHKSSTSLKNTWVILAEFNCLYHELHLHHNLTRTKLPSFVVVLKTKAAFDQPYSGKGIHGIEVRNPSFLRDSHLNCQTPAKMLF